MNTVHPRESQRPGGRSARVQESVHRAVRELLAELGREDITVPQIAARAGVTPSTIYRRWGDLQQLLADVAVRRMQPEREPADTGSLRGDLRAWLEQYVEEMASQPGRAMLRDVVGAASDAGQACPCAVYTADTLQAILDRAAVRGEAGPAVQRIMDGVVAPVIYRILFGLGEADAAHALALLDDCLAGLPGPAARRGGQRRTPPAR